MNEIKSSEVTNEHQKQILRDFFQELIETEEEFAKVIYGYQYDAHLDALELGRVDDLRRQQRHQGEREEAVCDRSAERGHLRHLRVDVDELVIAGRVRELVDHLLRDLDPVADPLLPDAVLHLVDGDRRHTIPLRTPLALERTHPNRLGAPRPASLTRPEAGK